MKLGTESRNQTIFAAVLGVIAILLFWRSFFVGPSIPGAPPAPAQVGSAANPLAPRPANSRNGVRKPESGAPNPEVNPLDPRLRLDLLRTSEETEYEGSGRNIFRAQAEPVIPKPLDNGLKKQEEAKTTPPPPPPAPTAPPLPFKAFGVATRAGEPRRVFLSQGDDVLVAKEGDVVDRHYKIVKINANSVEVEDLLNNNPQTNHQSIPLTAG
jgi:hypothetical protein